MAFYDDIVGDQVAPPFLQQGAYQKGPGVSGRYLQACGLALDALATRAKQASLVSLPGQGDPSALPFLGSDRLMLQGPSEPNDNFALRLSGAFDVWAHAGNDWAILQEALAFLLPAIPPALIVSDRSVWSYYGAGANTGVPPQSVNLQTIPNWNWDNDQEVTGQAPGATPWWRFWLVLFSYAPNAWAVAGPALGTPGQPTLGNAPSWSLGFSNIPPSFWVGLRQAIVRNWKAAHAWCRWIIVSLDSAHYDVDQPAAGGVNPDGTFGPNVIIVNGVHVANPRFSTSRYIPGVAF